ncbi:MAG TPA: Ig-like domain-containing protein, partial [Ramlibacter sp.]
IADPARVGPVTGSPLPNFTDHTGASRSHNTFRIEVRRPSPTHDGELIYVADGERNFTLTGRLLTGPLAGKVTPTRATYKADASGNVTDLDVFATATATSQARLPAQPQPAPVTPVLNFYDVPCGGAVTVDPVSGESRVNPPPYTAPAGTSRPMASAGGNYWGQSQPGGLPPSHVCVEDANARNALGQIVPEYHLKPVTDDVTITAASYDGAANATLTVNAVSSDPTAVLTLAGYGPAPAETPGAASGVGAGTGLELAGNAASVSGLLAPPARVQVVSSKRGVALRNTETARGAAAPAPGTAPTAVNDSGSISEDCSATAATSCSGPQLTLDLLANDTVVRNGSVVNLRDFVNQGLGTVSVTAQAPSLGLASISPDGVLTYRPNANANGLDNVPYTVSVDGQPSNQAIAAVNITPVNDLPVAGNVSAGAAVGVNNTLNLISASTDPDGNTDVRDAVIESWPAGLGTQPAPSNGTVSFLPASGGTYSITFRVKDAAGAVSATAATANVTVSSETITVARAQFEGDGKNRWRVDGTDSILAGQTLSVVYADGVLRSTGTSCNGTASIPACVSGTVVVDGAGGYSLDQQGVSGTKVPTSTTAWSVLPRTVRVYSSAPVLGGSANAAITIKN